MRDFLYRRDRHSFTRTALLAMMLGLASTCAAHAQSGALDRDPENPLSTFPDPSLKNSAKIPPSAANGGVAYLGPALSRSVVPKEVLVGQGPECTPISPCAAVYPSSQTQKGLASADSGRAKANGKRERNKVG